MNDLTLHFRNLIRSNLCHVLLLLTIYCSIIPDAHPQNGCDNGDFENGNFTNWTGAKGRNDFGLSAVLDGTAIFNPAGLPYGVYSGPPGTSTNAINLVSQGTDYVIPSITTTHSSSNNAARIGNAVWIYGMDLLSKTFVVDNATSNFNFWYAVILQNPDPTGHTLNQQPFFVVRVKNSAGVLVPNLGLTVVADFTNPFFQVETVFGQVVVYRNWDCSNLDLSAFTGQQVTVEFISGDCGLGGHWGYVYIDDICLGCDGSPTGDCSIDELPDTCNNLPMRICGDFTLPQPPAPATASLSGIDLRIYQNGIQVGTTLSNPVINNNTFCFTLNASDFPAVPPDGFDFVASANFIVANGSTITNITKSSSTPGNGIKPGMNNDYKLICDAVDTTCIRILNDTTYCDSTGTYIYEFEIRNNSPTKYIEELEIAVDSPQPPNYVVAVPSNFTFSPPIPPLGSSGVKKVKLIGPGAVATSQVCYTLSAHFVNDDCPWCCFIENCIKLEECGTCAEVVQDSIYCVNGEYFFNFTLQNGTRYNVTKIQLTSPGIQPITFIPQTFHFGTPILPGQMFPNLTTQILGGAAGMNIPVRIKLFSGTFECCYFELNYTLPSCCDSVKICAKTCCPGDTLNVWLADSDSPHDSLFSATAIPDSNGCAYFKFPDAEPGESYYIVVGSSNSIETWSATPQVINGSGCLEYDFTTDSSKAYGNNMTNINGFWTLHCGDVNQDGVIDMEDVMLVYNAATNFETGITDLNCDGLTDLMDVFIVYNNSLNFVMVMKPQ